MKHVSLLFFLCCCLSCTHEEANRKTKVLKLNPDEIEDVNLSDFVSNAEFLKLETNKLFGSIEKLVVTENRIYILDAYNSLALYVYNRKGEFLFEIANYGRGPGEFMGPYDFAVDGNEIVIYDARSLKLSFYDIKDGSFIEDKLLDTHFRRFSRIGNYFLFYMDNRVNKNVDYNMVIKDRDLKNVSEGIPIIEKMRGVYFLMPLNFSKHNDSVFFTAHSDYNIYRFDSSEAMFYPYLEIDFGKRSAPDEFYKKHRTSADRQESLGDAAHFVSNYFETDRFSFFLYWVNNTTYYYLASKVNGKKIHTTNNKLIDDLGLGPLIRWPGAVIGNSLVWYQQPTVLLKYIDEKRKTLIAEQWHEFEQINKNLISFAETLSENDNPYLIFMEIDF